MKSLTYLVYIIAWEAITIGGAAYIVFGLDKSPWWFLLAIILSGNAYKPSHWGEMYDKKNEY